MNAVVSDWQQPLRRAAQMERCVENVLVPLDGSSSAKAALPVARTLARLENATLHVMYACNRLLGPLQTLQELGIGAEELNGAVLDRETGEPPEAILRRYESLPSALLVMTTHTGDEQTRGALGAVAEAALSAAPRRIVLVPPARGDRPWALHRILLAHDGTPTSDRATAPAANLALRSAAEVIALHVAARTSSRPMEPGSMPAPRYIDQPQHEWPAWAGQFMERMMALGAPPAAVNFNLLVTGGQPGSEIAQFARDRGADLVVMSWHGRWRPQKTGVLKVVVRRCGCPVLLVCRNGQQE